MTLEEIIGLLENRTSFIEAQVTAAEQRGDIVAVEQGNNDLMTTQATLDQLKTLM